MARLAFHFVNLGLAIGLTFAAILLLRPILKRVLTPQQRVWLWVLGWLPAYMAQWYAILNAVHILPVTFQDLITPRVNADVTYSIPEYLPLYRDPGPYNLALPGGTLIPVELNGTLSSALGVIWVIGAVVVAILFSRRERATRKLLSQGEAIPPYGVWLEGIPRLERQDIQVRLCSGLETSFLYHGHAKGEDGAIRYTVCLQRELPPERRELVLRHEVEHVRLWHPQFKVYANTALILHWWNPLMWLAHKYFCRDMELACDRAVLRKLEPNGRREYAHTLVELGAGRQLWDAPLCFGECDAELRVRAVAAWKKPGWLKTAAGWAAFALVFLFFLGGPHRRSLPQDVPLAWDRQELWAATVQTPEEDSSGKYGQAQGQLQQEARPVQTLAENIAGHLEEQGVTARLQSVWLTFDDLEQVVCYARLTDGSWHEVYYYYYYNSRLFFARVEELAQPPETEGLYQIM